MLARASGAGDVCNLFILKAETFELAQQRATRLARRHVLRRALEDALRSLSPFERRVEQRVSPE